MNLGPYSQKGFKMSCTNSTEFNYKTWLAPFMNTTPVNHIMREKSNNLHVVYAVRNICSLWFTYAKGWPGSLQETSYIRAGIHCNSFT